MNTEKIVPIEFINELIIQINISSAEVNFYLIFVSIWFLFFLLSRLLLSHNLSILQLSDIKVFITKSPPISEIMLVWRDTSFNLVQFNYCKYAQRYLTP